MDVHDDPYPDLSGNPFLDALAFVGAKERRDSEATDRILDSADLKSLAHVLAQMVQSAVGPRDLPAFLDIRAEKALGKTVEAQFSIQTEEDDS